jgi:hypothetical protein
LTEPVDVVLMCFVYNTQMNQPFPLMWESPFLYSEYSNKFFFYNYKKIQTQRTDSINASWSFIKYYNKKIE